MAINIVYQPDPMLVGEAAYQIGQGEYARDQQDQAFRQQQLAEQQRQFDARNALDQQQFDLARENSVFEQQLARNREQLARRGLAMDFLNRQQDIGAQFMLQDQQQRGAMARQAAGIQAEAGQQFQQYAFAGMQADFKRVLDSLPSLSPEQRAQVMDQFHNNWSSYNIPLPSEFVPPVPEWQDKNAIWERARTRQQKNAEQGYEYDLVPDENGNPSIPRGTPAFPQTPMGLQKSFEYQRELEGMKTQFKQEETQARVEQKQAEQKQKWEEHDQDMYQKWEAGNAEMLWKDHNARMPKEDEFKTPHTDPVTGKEEAKTDYAAWNAAMKTWRAQAPPPPRPPGMPNQQLPSPQQNSGRKSVPSSPDQPISVSSLEEAASYAPGTWVRTPSGKVGQVR